MSSSRRKHDAFGFLRRVAALVVGSLPSFAVPFVASAASTSDRSDPLLLILAINLTVMAVGVYSIEVGVIGALGATKTVSGMTLPTMLKLSAVLLTRAWLCLAVSFVVTTLGFLATPESARVLVEGLREHGLALFAPLLASAGAGAAGYLAASNRIATLLLINGIRNVPLLIALITQASPALLVASVLAGEVARLGLLALAMWALTSREVMLEERVASLLGSVQVSARGLLDQAIWVGTSQLNVLLLRVFFAAGPQGAVTLGEMGLRIQNVASQVAISGYVMSRVAAIPNEFAALNDEDARRRAIQDMWRAAIVGVAVSGAVIAASVLASGILRLDTTLLKGLVVGAILCLSCGPVAASTWASRLTVYFGRSRSLVFIGLSISLVLAASLWVVLQSWSANAAAAAFVVAISLGALAYAINSIRFQAKRG